MSALAGHFGARQPTVTDSVIALERKGLVCRQADLVDARAVVVKVMPNARPRKALECPSHIAAALADLSEAEQASLLKTPIKLIRNLQLRKAIPPQRLCVTCKYFPQATGDKALSCPNKLSQAARPKTSLAPRGRSPPHEEVAARPSPRKLFLEAASHQQRRRVPEAFGPRAKFVRCRAGWGEGAQCQLPLTFRSRSLPPFEEKRRPPMARVNLVDPITATGAAKPLLDEIKGAFGAAQNMFRAVANSPAASKSMWAAFGAPGGGNDRRQARRKDRRGDRRPGRLLLLSRRAYAARKKGGRERAGHGGCPGRALE